MENYVITQERNGEITVLASSYKNAIFVGGDYLSDYETYNLEKVNNLLKDLQESNPDNEYRIMTENDFQEMRRNIEALKTPFGQNSKLNYKEWSFARSDEFKKQFGDWESKIKKDYLLSKNYAIELTGDEFSRKEDMTLTEQVEEYFNNENNVVVSPFFGKVVLDKKGVEDSLAHGMGRLKAIAYASVKDVINKGVILDIDENHKERGYNSYVVAAPIKIKDEDYICEVVLKKNKNETRFYLHEVTEQKKFLGQAFLTNLAQKPARQQGTLQSILEKTVLVNDNILCPLTENGEPEKSFVANELKKIQKYTETIDNSQTENPEESVEKSPKDIKPEISVVCGEIKSILGNKFTGGNIKLSQDFQHELIEKGLVNPEEEFVLINDAEAVAQGCKIKSDQPFVFLNIPVENNGKTDFVQTKYYHISALEESQKIEKNIIYGETKVPEFAIITQHGLKTYSNLIIESYDPTSHSYLLQSEDGSQRLNITEETYNELMSNTFQEKAQSFTDDDPAYNKLLETQYNDYFKQRDNTAYNFKHNLSVYCRKEANSPCNALEIAKGIISRMSVEEKNKTKSLLQKMANGKTLNEVIVDIYHEAIKEVPLNEEYIKIKVPEKVIARPFYDTISTNGNLVSKEHNLKIGDTLKNVNIKSDKLFGKGSENITFDELKIISSSKEGNCITLMDSNKSFVEIPLDTVLASYEKYKVNTQKQEKRNKVSMDISY